MAEGVATGGPRRGPRGEVVKGLRRALPGESDDCVMGEPGEPSTPAGVGVGVGVG